VIRRSGAAGWGFWSQGRGLCLFLLVALFVALEIPGTGSSAVAGPQCGGTVTSSVVLTKNLTCSGDGLYVDASVTDVTLDLHGHSISGSGAGQGLIVLSSSTSPVVIKDGTVKNFRLGIAVDYTSATLDNLFIRDNGVGVFTLGGGPVLLSNSTISNNSSDGVEVSGQPGDFRMVNDRVTGNGGNGISAFTDSLRLLANSFIAHNGGNGAWLSATVATVGGNTFLGNGGVGLFISEDTCLYLSFYNVSDNVANQNGQGGMTASANPFTCDTPPPGTGNAAQNNDVFQCILIVCAKNPGQAKQQSVVLAPRLLHNHP